MYVDFRCLNCYLLCYTVLINCIENGMLQEFISTLQIHTYTFIRTYILLCVDNIIAEHKRESQRMMFDPYKLEYDEITKCSFSSMSKNIEYYGKLYYIKYYDINKHRPVRTHIKRVQLPEATIDQTEILKKLKRVLNSSDLQPLFS